MEKHSEFFGELGRKANIARVGGSGLKKIFGITLNNQEYFVDYKFVIFPINL